MIALHWENGGHEEAWSVSHEPVKPKLILHKEPSNTCFKHEQGCKKKKMLLEMMYDGIKKEKENLRLHKISHKW